MIFTMSHDTKIRAVVYHKLKELRDLRKEIDSILGLEG